MSVVISLGLLAGLIVVAISKNPSPRSPGPTGVTGGALVGLTSACNADAKTLDVAVVAAQAENPTLAPTGATWAHSDLTAAEGGTADDVVGGPYLQSWPTANAQWYSISVAGGSAKATSDGTKPSNGDVLVTVTATGLTRDYTVTGSQVCTFN